MYLWLLRRAYAKFAFIGDILITQREKIKFYF